MNNNALRDLRHKYRKTMLEVAKGIGATTATISNLENGKHPISPKWALRLSEYFNCPREVFKEQELSRQIANDDYLTLPVFNEGNQTETPHAGIRTQPRMNVLLAGGWLRSLGVNRENGMIYEIRGDSMQPTLREGAMALIRKQDTIDDGKIHVFSQQDQVFAKRLLVPHPGVVRVVADNPAFEPYQISDDSSFRIIGRVLWAAMQL